MALTLAFHDFCITFSLNAQTFEPSKLWKKCQVFLVWHCRLSTRDPWAPKSLGSIVIILIRIGPSFFDLELSLFSTHKYYIFLDPKFHSRAMTCDHFRHPTHCFLKSDDQLGTETRTSKNCWHLDSSPCGILVKPESHEEFVSGLSKAMLSLATDDKTRQRMGEAATRRSTEHFLDWKSKVDRIAEVIEETVSLQQVD